MRGPGDGNALTRRPTYGGPGPSSLAGDEVRARPAPVFGEGGQGAVGDHRGPGDERTLTRKTEVGRTASLSESEGQARPTAASHQAFRGDVMTRPPRARRRQQPHQKAPARRGRVVAGRRRAKVEARRVLGLVAPVHVLRGKAGGRPPRPRRREQPDRPAEVRRRPGGPVVPRGRRAEVPPGRPVVSVPRRGPGGRPPRPRGRQVPHEEAGRGAGGPPPSSPTRSRSCRRACPGGGTGAAASRGRGAVRARPRRGGGDAGGRGRRRPPEPGDGHDPPQRDEGAGEGGRGAGSPAPQVPGQRGGAVAVPQEGGGRGGDRRPPASPCGGAGPVVHAVPPRGGRRQAPAVGRGEPGSDEDGASPGGGPSLASLAGRGRHVLRPAPSADDGARTGWWGERPRRPEGYVRHAQGLTTTYEERDEAPRDWGDAVTGTSDGYFGRAAGGAGGEERGRRGEGDDEGEGRR
ncbi:hypothetical protein THAOC_32638 [Thalassiosira oceanica]|uniref:Uncharacterized protein n=1 Tax=Thalassiosira oceanica TaxID=159749 RepID=K0R6Q9_THAOC|nr:hypothetical protein THAOC_32638 [Thalassiosira oceanica]|eukprot:EJK48555.1 hypothetical protein THAOC_32638 [Thalassiosira oceanica]